jgi:hypothetical protein
LKVIEGDRRALEEAVMRAIELDPENLPVYFDPLGPKGKFELVSAAVDAERTLPALRVLR